MSAEYRSRRGPEVHAAVPDQPGTLPRHPPARARPRPTDRKRPFRARSRQFRALRTHRSLTTNTSRSRRRDRHHSATPSLAASNPPRPAAPDTPPVQESPPDRGSPPARAADQRTSGRPAPRCETCAAAGPPTAGAAGDCGCGHRGVAPADAQGRGVPLAGDDSPQPLKSSASPRCAPPQPPSTPRADAEAGSWRAVAGPRAGRTRDGGPRSRRAARPRTPCASTPTPQP